MKVFSETLVAQACREMNVADLSTATIGEVLLVAQYLEQKTGIPFVSRYSIVRFRSRMAFAPAQTTRTGVLVNSSRSAEISMVVSAPLCTPPIPPVAKT